MRNTRPCIPTIVFLMGLHRRGGAAVQTSSTPSVAGRAAAWKLGATRELLQGPAIAIRITKIRKSSPGLHVDLTDVSTSFDQFLTDGFHVRDHQEKPFEGSGLHGGDAHPNRDGAG